MKKRVMILSIAFLLTFISVALARSSDTETHITPAANNPGGSNYAPQTFTNPANPNDPAGTWYQSQQTWANRPGQIPGQTFSTNPNPGYIDYKLFDTPKWKPQTATYDTVGVDVDTFKPQTGAPQMYKVDKIGNEVTLPPTKAAVYQVNKDGSESIVPMTKIDRVTRVDERTKIDKDVYTAPKVPVTGTGVRDDVEMVKDEIRADQDIPKTSVAMPEPEAVVYQVDNDDAGVTVPFSKVERDTSVPVQFDRE